MIIWINGAFGAGKTTVAAELQKRIEDSFLFDPEDTGYFLRAVLPQELRKPDFQDLKLWREFNYKLLSHMAKSYKGPLIVPMTLVHPDYFESIVGQLRLDGVVVQHFTLAASRETLLRRLVQRGDTENSWPAEQIDRCLNALSDTRFEHIIHTDELQIEEVLAVILQRLERV